MNNSLAILTVLCIIAGARFGMDRGVAVVLMGSLLAAIQRAVSHNEFRKNHRQTRRRLELLFPGRRPDLARGSIKLR